MDYFDLRAWQITEAGITNELRPILADASIAPLWRATNYSVHILYSSCAQHADAGPCSHTEDEHALMGLGGRVLTNSLAAVRLLLAWYYGPSVALVRDSVESTMLLALFEAVPEDLPVWRSMTDSRARWKLFSPAKIRDKLVERKVLDDSDPSRKDLALAVAITVRGSELMVDLTGTAPQVPDRPINMPLEGTVDVAIWLTLRSILLDSAVCGHIPQNSGLTRPITIVAPRGTLANPIFPAPTSPASAPAISSPTPS